MNSISLSTSQRLQAAKRDCSEACLSDERQRDDLDRWVSMVTSELNHDARDPLPASRVAQPKQSTEARHTNRSDANSPVTLVVEFGRTQVPNDPSAWDIGTRIPLAQAVNEPLDILANGKLIARGEMVVTDGRLGVRIVERFAMSLVMLWCLSATAIAEDRARTKALPTQVEFESLGFETHSESATDERRATRGTSARNSSIPLTPPSFHRSQDDIAAGNAVRSRHASSSAWSSVIWWLVIGSGLLLAGTRWFKSRAPQVRSLPSEAFEILSRRAIDQRTSVLLARCGKRLLLLSSSPMGLRTLAEINDPVEVDCLAGLCHASSRDQNLSETWRSLLRPLSARSETLSSLAESDSLANEVPLPIQRRTSLPTNPVAEVRS